MMTYAILGITSLLLAVLWGYTQVRHRKVIALDFAQHSTDSPSPTRQTSHQAVSGPLLEREQLLKLKPVDQLEPVFMDDLSRETLVYPAGTQLFAAGSPVDSLLYLLEGSIYLELQDDETPGQEVAASSLKALYPLAMGDKHIASGYAKTRVRILHVQKAILDHLQDMRAQTAPGLELRSLPIPENLRYSALFNSFCDHFQRDKLQLPALPNVAMRLSQAIEQEISISEAVRIVQLDAGIAAKLIQVANSPLYRSQSPITNCLNAVNRLGLKTTRNIVLSASLGNLVECHDPRIEKRLQEVWKQSLLISSMSNVLATCTPGISAEEAQLAGLISDIGIIPFLHYAASLPRELYRDSEIDAAIPLIRGEVGSYLLKQWGFPEAMQAVPKLSEDWYHQSGKAMTLADIVMLSKLHSYIGTDKMAQVPFINAVPAYAKLKDNALTPEFSLDVLNRSRSQINDIIKFFQNPL